ncbi:MAG: hypothetical protein PHE27_08880 [Alphaproteobacteria bacterium]|nr:hypothetical protein [Alphaproteobacteria bacterium]
MFPVGRCKKLGYAKKAAFCMECPNDATVVIFKRADGAVYGCIAIDKAMKSLPKKRRRQGFQKISVYRSLAGLKAANGYFLPVF